MTQHNAIKLFETKKVRTIWDDKEEKWYFSIVDVVAVLTDSPNPRKYWSVLKTRLKKEGTMRLSRRAFAHRPVYFKSLRRNEIIWHDSTTTINYTMLAQGIILQ